ncbi:hypothetical protein ACH5RR_033967 [Cinchona calisaya]|uniref:Uncharacterized protein n=1 Tax=Cinchona calisaya TaxID=153742 RepID=A0ABD2Y9I4_9GENT
MAPVGKRFQRSIGPMLGVQPKPSSTSNPVSQPSSQANQPVPFQFLSQQLMEALDQCLGSDSSSDLETTKGGFDSPMNDNSSSEDETAVKDSIYEKIIGPEKLGRMHTYDMGPTPKDIWTSNHTSVAQKKAFDDAVNKMIEAMHIQMSAEMDAKLCRFKDDLISQFEERIHNLAPLQREMITP